jgi:hypothetical protein
MISNVFAQKHARIGGEVPTSQTVLPEYTVPQVPTQDRQTGSYNVVGHGHGYPMPHETPVGLEHGESFILLFMFYEVLHEQFMGWNILSRLVSLYERVSGKQKHRHVGISLGIRKNNRDIVVLPYDLSCWNSRESGISNISSHSGEVALGLGGIDTELKPNMISASDALYVDIHVTTFDQILHNFKLNSDAYVWNKLPRKGIRYPTLTTILRDGLYYMLYYYRKAVDLQEVDIELEKINNEAQCAQYVLILLIYLLRTQQIQYASNIHMNTIFSLVYQKTSLHPHTLWNVLLDTKVFNVVSNTCSVVALQQFSRNRNHHGMTGKLSDIKLDNPYDTLIALNEILIYEFKYTHQFI